MLFDDMRPERRSAFNKFSLFYLHYGINDMK